MLPVLPTAVLALADGTVFQGRSIGADGVTVGEVVFNTSLTGYQEILTDPSYCRQIVTLTYPHIGSYGIMDAKATNADPQNNVKMNLAGYKNCNNVLKAYPSTITASALFCFVSLAICICLFCYAVAILSQPYDKTDDLPEVTQTMVQMAPQTTHEPATFTMMPAPAPMMPVTAPMLVPSGMPMGGGMAPVTFGLGGISGTPLPMSMMHQQQMQMPMPPFTTMAPGPKAV